MAQPEIITANSIAEALSWLDEYGTQGGAVLAGGTDLFLRWQSEVPKPQHILYIGEIQELNGVDIRQDDIWIGSLTTMADIAKSTEIIKYAPSLTQAASVIGSPAVRERATIGGNICNASPAADTATPLIALNAEVEIRNSKESRSVAMDDLFTGPGETILQKNELLTGIIIPIIPYRRDFYHRLAQRKALGIVKVSVAVTATKVDGKLYDVRIVLGAVAPIPLLAHKTMAVLEEKHPTITLIEQAVNMAMEECNPIDDIRSTIEYRRLMVGELLREGIDKLNTDDR